MDFVNMQNSFQCYANNWVMEMHKRRACIMNQGKRISSQKNMFQGLTSENKVM